ncbi:MAG: alkaline phosphatase family protein, partial [Deltaproteobacteria bacterium]|nr:alkaline phosphatase family protein [Deltaproteobacteria bacterium]
MDGATFDLIRPWVSEGLLPNLGRLMAEGAHGELTTTIQPLTGPAWTSFMTGMNPGKHGVFDFISRVPGTYDVRLVDSHTKRGRSLWRILSEHGRKVIVLDIPGNYPPEPVNGLLVSWMDAPGVDREFTHPPELSRQLKEALGEYVLSVNFSAPLEAHVQDIFRITDNRAAAAEYLLEKHAWDFFIVLFSGSDFAQHAFWKYMDPGHPRYDAAGAAKYGRVILDVYRRIDEHLGRLLARLDGRAAVFVVSDHGSGPLRRVVNLNRWLEERRWLAFRDNDASETGTSLTGVLRRGGVRATQALVGWAKSAPPAVKGRLKRLLPGLSGRLESRLLASTIDWPRTKAFALGAYGNIWINLRGREPAGTVE